MAIAMTTPPGTVSVTGPAHRTFMRGAVRLPDGPNRVEIWI
jgi:hypothetical protein